MKRLVGVLLTALLGFASAQEGAYVPLTALEPVPGVMLPRGSVRWIHDTCSSTLATVRCLFIPGELGDVSRDISLSLRIYGYELDSEESSVQDDGGPALRQTWFGDVGVILISYTQAEEWVRLIVMWGV